MRFQSGITFEISDPKLHFVRKCSDLHIVHLKRVEKQSDVVLLSPHFLESRRHRIFRYLQKLRVPSNVNFSLRISLFDELKVIEIASLDVFYEQVQLELKRFDVRRDIGEELVASLKWQVQITQHGRNVDQKREIVQPVSVFEYLIFQLLIFL